MRIFVQDQGMWKKYPPPKYHLPAMSRHFHGDLRGRNRLSILRINPPKFAGGLNFKPDTGPDTGIKQKGGYFAKISS